MTLIFTFGNKLSVVLCFFPDVETPDGRHDGHKAVRDLDVVTVTSLVRPAVGNGRKAVPTPAGDDASVVTVGDALVGTHSECAVTLKKIH